MEQKKCTKCLLEKEIKEYKTGNICKECIKKAAKVRYEQNKAQRKQSRKPYTEEEKERKKEYNKIYRKNNKDKNKKTQKIYANEHKEELKNRSRAYKQSNKEKIKTQTKTYKEQHKEELKLWAEKYAKENKEKIKEREKAYRKTNREKTRIRMREYLKKYVKERIAKDPQFKIRMRISYQMYACLKHRGLTKAGGRWQDLVGYTVQELKEHLEKRFKPEMSWENYGSYWHIDHIRPQSWFHYEDMEDPEFKKCWALENLQPLEAIKNMSKGNRRAG